MMEESLNKHEEKRKNKKTKWEKKIRRKRREMSKKGVRGGVGMNFSGYSTPAVR